MHDWTHLTQSYSLYNSSLAAGVSAGIIISGLITIHLSWRYIYYVAVALLGLLILLVFFTFPETAMNRSPVDVPGAIEAPSELYTSGMKDHDEGMVKTHVSHLDNTKGSRVANHNSRPLPVKRSFVQSLALSHGRFTEESYFKMFLRPIVLLALPQVLWATLVMSVTIGFLVAISSNFASAFNTTYNFASWQSGLCFISGMVGVLLGIFAGGWVSDKVADMLTRRNGGIREPEMRLPAIVIGLITSPLGLVLYGVAIDNNLHWIVPTLGLGFCKTIHEPCEDVAPADASTVSFAVAKATNVSLVYVIDSYRPIAGETVVTQLAFKCKA